MAPQVGGGDRRQYKNLTVTHSDSFHDRFILVDGTELHNLGSSINCLGRRVTSYSTRDKKEIKKLLVLLPKCKWRRRSDLLCHCAANFLLEDLVFYDSSERIKGDALFL